VYVSHDAEDARGCGREARAHDSAPAGGRGRRRGAGCGADACCHRGCPCQGPCGAVAARGPASARASPFSPPAALRQKLAEIPTTTTTTAAAAEPAPVHTGGVGTEAGLGLTLLCPPCAGRGQGPRQARTRRIAQRQKVQPPPARAHGPTHTHMDGGAQGGGGPQPACAGEQRQRRRGHVADWWRRAAYVVAHAWAEQARAGVSGGALTLTGGGAPAVGLGYLGGVLFASSNDGFRHVRGATRTQPAPAVSRTVVYVGRVYVRMGAIRAGRMYVRMCVCVCGGGVCMDRPLPPSCHLARLCMSWRGLWWAGPHRQRR
jgi:hypothetical protein